MDTVNLMDLNLQETEEFVAGLGEPKYRGRQIFGWIHRKGVSRFADMTNLPAALRERLQAVSITGALEVVTCRKSADGTAKYLFGLQDGNAVESVFLPHEYGIGVCVSSQVGCRMGCRFCASTIGGLVRDLSAGEIYAQVTGIEADTGARVGSIVVMGSGEPMDNLPAVIKFIQLVTSPAGLQIGARHITVSTCGVVPGIRELAREDMQITLSVSLHAPNDEIRDSIMPINRKYPIGDLMEACRDYIAATNRRITFEYALINEFNDTPENARELARLLKGMLCHVNLIPLNKVEEREFQRSHRERVNNFAGTLEKMGIPVTVRKEMGSDIDAACGQLRRRAAQGNFSPGRR